MSEHQYDNPFFQEGILARKSGLTRSDCPYDYLKYDTDLHIETEIYRQKEWLTGFNYQDLLEIMKDEKPNSYEES
jgi:hypothetical protein